MLLLDKTLPTQKIIVTVSTNQLYRLSKLILRVINKASNRNHEFVLGQNISPYPKRYDEFSFSTDELIEWKEGMYVYEIWEEEYEAMRGEVLILPTGQTNPLEIGLLKVIDVKEETFISVEEDNTADDYIIYE